MCYYCDCQIWYDVSNVVVQWNNVLCQNEDIGGYQFLIIEKCLSHAKFMGSSFKFSSIKQKVLQ